jgi:hypothetical protein
MPRWFFTSSQGRSTDILVGKKSSTTEFSTCRKPLNRYQKILSDLPVIIRLTITLKWSMQQWKCSHCLTNIRRFANQNCSGPPNTLRKRSFILVCFSFRCLPVVSPFWTTLLAIDNDDGRTRIAVLRPHVHSQIARWDHHQQHQQTMWLILWPIRSAN